MKIVDEKGRFLGKINIIDLAVVLFLISVLPGVYFAQRIGMRKKSEAEAVVVITEEVTLKVKFRDIMPEISDFIKEESAGSEAVKVISDKPAGVLRMSADDGSLRIVGHPEHRDLILEIKAVCEKRDSGLFYDNKPVKVGLSFDLSTEEYSARGIIIGMERKQNGEKRERNLPG